MSNELIESYNGFGFTFEALNEWRLNGFTKKYVKHFLARITGYIEEGSDKQSKYVEYVDKYIKDPYEIEHIIPDHYEWYKDEYESKETFDSYRNNIGDLLLLPKSVNASLNDSKYDIKIKKYCSNEGNIYSASLDEITYRNNTRFIYFIEENNLSFKPCITFGRAEIDERFRLVEKLAKLIWNENNLKIK